MAIAIRDVLLTRLFGCNDWSTLDDEHVDGEPSRFAKWPDIFEKEEVKKASDSKPRKRNAKADKKVKKAKVVPTTSTESSNPDSAITEQVSVETSPK